MSKNITRLLSLGVALLCAFSSFAQVTPTVTFLPPSATIMPDDTITIYVTGFDFTEVSGISGTIDWDPNFLDFHDIPEASISIPGMTPPDCPQAPLCSFNTTFLPDGHLNLLWFDFSSAFTFGAGDTLWTMRFVGKANGVTSLSITDELVDFTVTLSDGMGGVTELEPIMNGSTITVDDGSTMGDPCAGFPDLAIYAEQDSAATGEQVCVDISSCNFDEMVTMSYTLEFDPALLSFDSMANFNLAQSNNGNFNTALAPNGLITVSWFDSTGTGVNHPDGAAMYSACFNVIGSGGQITPIIISDSLTNIEASDTSFMDMPFDTQNGQVKILGNSTAAMSLSVSSETVAQNDQACLDVSVSNFTDMLSLDFSLDWDPAIIQFDTILDPNNFFMGNVAGSIDTSPGLVNAGNLSVEWSSGTPVTQSDNFILFQVCYDAIGAGGTNTDVAITDDVVTIDATASDGGGGSVPVNVNPTSGNVEILGSGVFTFNTTDADVCPGEQVCVEYIARGFNQIAGFGGTLNWDTTFLDFVSITNVGLPPATTFVVNDLPSTVDTGNVAWNWFTFDLNNLPSYNDADMVPLIEFCFTAKDFDGNAVTFVFNDDVIATSAFDINGQVPDQRDPGTVTITNSACTSMDPPVVTETVTNVDCNGNSTGAIDITVTGNMPFTYNWEGPNSFTSMDEDLTGLLAGTYDLTVTDAVSLTTVVSYTVTEPDALDVTFTKTDIACNGGTEGAIDVSVTGGTTTYSYLWNDMSGSTSQDLSGLAAGTYKLIVTDANSCQDSVEVTITEPTALSTSFTVTEASCNGGMDGAIDLTVSGGSTPYTYLWNDPGTSVSEDISGLAAGTYKVIITDANSCLDSVEITVSENAAFTVMGVVTNVTCNGENDGSIDLTVTGATGTVSYAWNNGAGSNEDPTGLGPNTYQVTITDDNCEIIESYTVTEPTELTASPIPTDASCAGGGTDGSIDLTVSGGSSPYTYMWDNGAGNSEDPSGLSANTYCVTVTDANSCTATTCAVVGVTGSFTIAGVVTNVTCNGEDNGSIDLTVTGATGTPTFAWDNGAGSNEDPTGLGPNTYTVTVTDNGCSVTESFVVTEPAVLTAVPIPTNVSCNGGSDGSIDLTVSGGSTPYTYVWDNSAGSNEDPNGLVAATYCVTVTDANDCVITTCAPVGEPTPIIISGTVTDQSMGGSNDGAIAITVTGGTTPYTSFSWSGPMSYSSSDEDIINLAPGTYTVTITDNAGCMETASFVVAPADAPVISNPIITDAACNGEASGGVDITVTGGATPYTFIWDNAPPSMTEDLTGVPAGSYSVTVTDASMVSVTAGPFVVGEATAITYSETHEDASCFGVFDGEIHLDINGGTTPYTVNWNVGILNGPDLVGLAPGNYTPTIVDNNGCTLPGTLITIGEPDSMTISVAQLTPVTCNGGNDGAINLSISGGTAAYNVAWSNGAMTQNLSGLMAGNYTPTVTDANGCTKVGPTVTITEPNAIEGNASVSPILCEGDTNGAVDLSPSGGTAPYTFLWNNGLGSVEDISNLGPGSYSVTITDDEGCTKVEGPFSMTNPTVITINENVVMPTAANNDGEIDLMASGGTGPYTYNWTGPGGPYTGEPLLGLSSGEYRVTVTDANGCVAFETYLLTGDFGANGLVNDASCNGGSDGSVILDVQGGISPYTYEWDFNNVTSANLLNVPAGTYCVTVTDLPTMAVIIECFDVGEPTPIDIKVLSVVDETGAGCNGAINIDVSGGNPPYAYLWSDGSISKNLSDVCKGNYTVAVTDANGCFVESPSITVLASPIVCSNIVTEDTKCHDSDDGTAEITFFGGCEPYVIQLDNGDSQTSLDGNVIFSNLAPGMYVGNIFDNQGQAKTFEFTIGSPDPISITVENITPNTGGGGANCNGAINITVGGGTAPFSATWNNGATSEDLFDVCGSGSPFSVTIVDANGCVMTLGGLSVPDLPTVNVDLNNQLNETCFENCDGQLSVLASGGVPPFSYAWSNGGTTATIIGLCPDTYTVTVTDGNGTAEIRDYVITGATSALTETGTVTDAQGAAENGSITLTVAGGVPPYSYEWSNGATSNPVIGLAPGVYNVVITDANDCIINGSYIVGSNILLAEFANDAPSCNGSGDGCIEAFPVSGQGPYTYLWSNGSTTKKICTLEGGSYTVTITDANGLSAILENNLINPDPLELMLEDLGGGSAEVIVSGGTSPYFYAWNDSNGSTTAVVEGVNPGSYGVLVTDSRGCIAEGAIDIKPEGECEDVRQVISPNSDGKNDEFVVVCVFEYPENTLEVYNRYGQIVFQAENYDNTWEGTDQDGALLPETGYFWVFKYRDAEGVLQTVKGHLTILNN